MSNEPTPEQIAIDDMNEAIAIFDGWQLVRDHEVIVNGQPVKVDCFIKERQHPKYHYDLKYHSSWDALMPVVGKIETIENGRFGLSVDPWSIVIVDYKECYDGKAETEVVNILREWEKGVDKNDYLKECYYEAVTQFLQWYNKQKEVNNEQ